jgi:hypothetical protein
VTVGAWHWLGIRRDAAGTSFILDGRLHAVEPVPAPAEVCVGATAIEYGRRPADMGQVFAGAMRSILLYGRALDEAEIAAVCAAP